MVLGTKRQRDDNLLATSSRFYGSYLWIYALLCGKGKKVKCSPFYGQKNRQWANHLCDSNCWHWKACLKELDLPEDYQVKTLYQREANDIEIFEEQYHLDKKGNKLVWAVLKEKDLEV